MCHSPLYREYKSPGFLCNLWYIRRHRKIHEEIFQEHILYIRRFPNIRNNLSDIADRNYRIKNVLGNIRPHIRGLRGNNPYDIAYIPIITFHKILEPIIGFKKIGTNNSKNCKIFKFFQKKPYMKNL